MAKTTSFIPPTISNTLATIHITSIRVAAHEINVATNTSGEVTSTNHWLLHLGTSASTSIRLDITPTGAGASPACLVVSQLNYAISKNAIKTYQLDTRAGLTLKQVIDCLQSEGYDKYKFNSQGNGCRYWASCVVALFEQNQFITSSAQIQEAQSGLKTVWGPGGLPLPADRQTEILAGTFY